MIASQESAAKVKLYLEISEAVNPIPFIVMVPFSLARSNILSDVSNRVMIEDVATLVMETRFDVPYE